MVVAPHALQPRRISWFLVIEFGFKILAFTTEGEFVDEGIKELTHAVGIMCTIYDSAISPLVEDGGGAEFATKVFRGV